MIDPAWLVLLAELAPTAADTERTLLAKHVERYTARNSFDYFIHKDLRGFLRRELDLFVNSEVLNPDDLEQGDTPRLDRALARVRAVRHVGGKIIDFLAQLEDFQRDLWLKKKFVLETNWCVTLDRIPEELLPEIAANEAQCCDPVYVGLTLNFVSCTPKAQLTSFPLYVVIPWNTEYSVGRNTYRSNQLTEEPCNEFVL